MRSASFNSTRSESASVLIIVLWVAFGLVALALYFANSMSMELRAADNRVAATEAEQAIMGAVRYVSNILANAETKGTLPDLATYKYEAVPLGNATFWLIGRSDQQQTIGTTDVPTFGLTDENSKLNLNANNLSVNMFQQLPGMTAELAAAIKDWRDADDDVRENGAESDVYQRRNPPYRCKNADFESVDELRLVYGAELTILYGEDVNLNGILDPNENDGDISPPSDNRDGHLDRGILDFLTVFSWQPNIGTNIQNTNQIRALLQQNFGATKANQILSRPGVANSASVLEFYVRSGLTADEFQKIEQSIIVTNSPYVTNLVNVNTASEPVLTCIPGIGTDKASSLIAQRRQQATRNQKPTLTWVKDVLGQDGSIQAGRYLTSRSYQFCADIAAVGHHGRGYQRVRFIFDTSEGAPKIIYRQDLTHMGWALGRQVRNSFLLANNIR